MSTEDELVKVILVPVEVFGTEGCEAHSLEGTYTHNCEHCSGHGGYGLCDAVSAWSDCNRAIGHIYRREDPGFERNAEGLAQCIVVYVPRSELYKFDIVYGEP